MSAAREELAQIIAKCFRIHPNGVAYLDHASGADAIIAAGYAKRKVVGYLVVDLAGAPVGEDSYEDRAGAQGDADAWNEDYRTPGIYGAYRVAEIAVTA